MQYGYLELKLAWGLFQKAPDGLSETEQSRLRDVSEKQSRLERGILSTGEAAAVVVPAATLETRLLEIRNRYTSDEAFRQDLEHIGLDQDQLACAVERDLRVEAVLEKIASTVPPVSAVDAEIYYRLHPEAFDRPEARRLRHILITYEHARDKAKFREKLESIRSTAKNAENFAQAALRHSQCPTAMEGGLLGIVKRNQLYPELEPAAFNLSPGEISEVLESPVGLHIMRCDEVFPSGMLPFAEVEGKIIQRLTEKRRSEAQRSWILGALGRR